MPELYGIYPDPAVRLMPNDRHGIHAALLRQYPSASYLEIFRVDRDRMIIKGCNAVFDHSGQFGIRGGDKWFIVKVRCVVLSQLKCFHDKAASPRLISYK